jgi:hypothetical protein
MKKGLTALLLSALLVSVGSVSAFVPKPSADEQQDFQLMFIQTAEEAVVKQNPKNPDRWIVTLRNVDPDVAYFSERPKKMAGKVTIENFLEEWKQGTRNNPTGALITQFSHSNLEGDGSNRQIVLSNPRFDKRNKTITYDAQNPLGSKNLREGKHQDPVLFIEKFN